VAVVPPDLLGVYIEVDDGGTRRGHVPAERRGLTELAADDHHTVGLLQRGVGRR